MALFAEKTLSEAFDTSCTIGSHWCCCAQVGDSEVVSLQFC